MDYPHILSQQLEKKFMDPFANIGGNKKGTMRPRGVEHDWDLRKYNEYDIRQRTKEVMVNLSMLFNRAGSASILSFDSLMKPLLEAQRYIVQMGALVTFPRHVAESAELRKASSDATKLLDDFSVEMSMRKDIFDNLVKYKEEVADKEYLNPEYARCLDKLIHNGRRNGLHLDVEIQGRIKTIKKRLNELTVEFSKNITEDNTRIFLTADELSGMPGSFLEGLEQKPETDQYEITMRYGHVLPISRKCTRPDIRELVERTYSARCSKENAKLLEEILQLRQVEANLLGYSNHAAYIQDILMAKNPDNVKQFLAELTPKLQQLWKAEQKVMLKMKKLECDTHNLPFNDKIDMWDFRYYACKIEEQKFNVKQDVLMEYFPLNSVTNGMMAIYEDILGLKFRQLTQAAKWSDDVRVYQVDDKETNEIMGYVYLDLFARPGKFGHACCVPIQPGCLGPTGKKQVAVSVMLTNFSSSRDNRPTLLDHKDVETYFHEFGHLMHYVCSRAKTALLFGTRVETDFLETPSQMLENWVWEKGPLKRLSCHWRTKEPIPDSLIEKLIQSRVAVAGGFNLRQVVLALVDQYLHLHPNSDSKKVYAQILKETMGLDAIPNTNICATFTHICIGYSARYYSYLWSEVYSADLFRSMFKSHGLDNTQIGLKYRQAILEPGGSLDASDMINNFLGREANNEAFLDSKDPSSANGK